MPVPSPTPTPQQAGYDLAPLSDADARAMLARVFGAERSAAMWADACRRAGLGTGTLAGPAELARLAEAFAVMGGAAGIVARSIEIRLRTHARLMQRAAGSTGARP
jgi:hypothetical protein